MSDMMTFPDTWEEYEKFYGFNDSEEIYTNNSRLIPSFRVKQWLDHIAQYETKQQATVSSDLISRQDLINELIKYCDKDCYNGNVEKWCGSCNHDEIVEIIKRMPSAEPERKKGKWIWQTENRYVCSECGYHTQVDELFEEPMYAFCPYCSTSMLDEDGNVRYER